MVEMYLGYLVLAVVAGFIGWKMLKKHNKKDK